MWTNVRKTVLTAVAAVALPVAAQAAGVTYTDTNPVRASEGGNWAPVQSSAGGLYVLSTGNSYSYYDTTVSPFTNNLLVIGFNHYETANVYWGVGTRYTAATVNPAAMGGIGSVDYQQIARKNGPDGVAQALLLMQNGKYYRTNFNVILPEDAPSQFQTFTGTGLTASDFGEFVGTSYGYGIPADGRANFASNPDFSAAGAPISFGWLGHFQNEGGGYLANDHPSLPPFSIAAPGAADSNVAYLMTTDFSITFNEVPEPGAFMLLAVAAPLMLRRRRGA